MFREHHAGPKSHPSRDFSRGFINLTGPSFWMGSAAHHCLSPSIAYRFNTIKQASDRPKRRRTSSYPDAVRPSRVTTRISICDCKGRCPYSHPCYPPTGKTHRLHQDKCPSDIMSFPETFFHGHHMSKPLGQVSLLHAIWCLSTVSIVSRS